MPEYVKLVFEGEPDVARGFILGWACGQSFSLRELDRNVLVPGRWDIRVESTLDSLVEAIRPGAAAVLIVETATADRVLEALPPVQGRLPLHLRARAAIRAAYFEFKYEIFDRKEAASVRAIFESLPDGADLSDDYSPEERSDPSASGAEMYAPVHAYVCRAKGTVGGNLWSVLQVHERCKQYERIQIGKVRLDLEP
jgi:hypothetical protein